MIHLFPANGISNIAYKELCSFLAPHEVSPFIYQPLQIPTPNIPRKLHWSYFSKDIDSQFSDVSNAIGVGHSLGATLLLHNAIKYPGRWKTIVIIEPALFSPLINRLYQIIRLLRLENYTHPMIRITKPRRDQFKSKSDTFNRWRNQRVFSFLSDSSLRHFVDASLIESSDGYTLRFPKDWECEIYRNMCSLDPFIWSNIDSLTTTKLIVVSGETSNTFFESARKRLRPFATKDITIPNTTHLLPFETPLALSRIILNHL